MRILFILTALFSPACSTTWWSVEAGSMGLNSQEGVAIATEAAPQTDETVEEVVENVEVPHASIANNNEASSTEESLSDQFRRAFNTENISITY